ncbi:MAG: DUF58 domain-containing protein [Chloroflexota bacterium]
MLEHVGYVLAFLDLLALTLVRMAGRGIRASSDTDRLAMTAGEEVEERYTIENHGLWPALWIEIELDAGDGDVERISMGLRGGGSQTVTTRRALLARGYYGVAGATVRVRDPMGLFSWTCARIEPVWVTVYPQRVPAPDAVDSARVLTSAHMHRIDGADATLGNLREYVQGDPPSRIHWRSTARRGTLMVTDPESQRHRAVWLLADLSGDEDRAEVVAGVAAYLAERLLQAGQAVGAIIAGEDLATIPLRRGREQSAQILTGLALALTERTSQLERIVPAARAIGDAGTMLLITPNAHPEHALSQLHSVCQGTRLVRIDPDARMKQVS